MLGRAAAAAAGRSTSRSSSRTTGRRRSASTSSGYFSREICPVLTPLAFDPGHPVPVHFEPEQELRGRRAPRRPHEVRARQGARRAAAVRPDSATRSAREGADLRVPRGRHPRQHPRAVSGHAGQGRASVPRSSATPTSRSRRTKPTTCSRRVDRSLKQLRHGAIALLQVEADMPARVLNILVENFEVTDDVVVRTADRLGLRRLDAADDAFIGPS